MSADLVDAGDKGSYLEQAPSLRLALGRLSLERKSLRVQDEDDADMHQVEMLLQAYFIQMDNTFNRLDTMNEYISDTEVCSARLRTLSIACCMWLILLPKAACREWLACCAGIY